MRGFSAPPYSKWREIIRWPSDCSLSCPGHPGDHPPDCRRRVRDGHLLFPILETDSGLAEKVQRLGLLADCHACYPLMGSEPKSHLLLPKCSFVSYQLVA